jgi:CBS domain-containing protein
MRARGTGVAERSVENRESPAGEDDATRALAVEDVMEDVHLCDADFSEKKENRFARAAPTCGPEELLVDVLVRLSSGGYGCVLVVDRETKKLVGTFTDGDLRRALGAEKTACTRRAMKELCSRTCRMTTIKTAAADALRAMAPEPPHVKVSFLPVVRDEVSRELVGIVTLNALVKAGL